MLPAPSLTPSPKSSGALRRAVPRGQLRAGDPPPTPSQLAPNPHAVGLVWSQTGGGEVPTPHLRASQREHSVVGPSRDKRPPDDPRAPPSLHAGTGLSCSSGRAAWRSRAGGYLQLSGLSFGHCSSGASSTAGASAAAGVQHADNSISKGALRGAGHPPATTSPPPAAPSRGYLAVPASVRPATCASWGAA